MSHFSKSSNKAFAYVDESNMMVLNVSQSNNSRNQSMVKKPTPIPVITGHEFPVLGGVKPLVVYREVGNWVPVKTIEEPSRNWCEALRTPTKQPKKTVRTMKKNGRDTRVRSVEEPTNEVQELDVERDFPDVIESRSVVQKNADVSTLSWSDAIKQTHELEARVCVVQEDIKKPSPPPQKEMFVLSKTTRRRIQQTINTDSQSHAIDWVALAAQEEWHQGQEEW